MKLITGMVPPGGWHYVEDGVRLTADGYEALLDSIFAYRLRSGKAPGNVRLDVDNYYCSRWPSSCNMEAHDYGHAAKVTASGGMPEAVARWAAGMASTQPVGGFPLVNQDIAVKRAEVCTQCPRNVSWSNGCNSCSSATSSLLLQIRRMRNTPHDNVLKACSLFGHENATAVHIEGKSQVTADEAKVIPPGCWKLNPDLK